MTTITHNDNVPEMLASIDRGPFAIPTESEKIRYLLTRHRRDVKRPDFEKYALEHVLSFQRRVHAIKESFMKRNVATPLGITIDYWDRTEAQARAALHSHILGWYRRREVRREYKALEPIPRTVPGTDLRQRTQKVLPLDERIEDTIYQEFEVGRVWAECVRPNVAGEHWGGYNYEKMRVAGLARAVQTRLPYLHPCNPAYCLKDRATCRFFFPWPEMPYQAYDTNVERVALMRRLPEDDAWVVTLVARQARGTRFNPLQIIARIRMNV